MLPFEQVEENLTRRYKRRETMERISFNKGLKEEGKTVSQIKEVLSKGKCLFGKDNVYEKNNLYCCHYR